jgi:hypothetical protein
MSQTPRDVDTQAPPEAPPPAGPGDRQPTRRGGRLQSVLAPIGSAVLFLAILGAWFGATRAGLISPIILPGPVDVGAALIDTLGSGFFYEHLGVTTYEVLMGFFIGTVADYPRIVLAHRDLHNVPERENLALGGWVNPWILPSPAVYDPETYFWDDPEEHG